jgi:hypothetical protein
MMKNLVNYRTFLNIPVNKKFAAFKAISDK